MAKTKTPSREFPSLPLRRALRSSFSPWQDPNDRLNWIGNLELVLFHPGYFLNTSFGRSCCAFTSVFIEMFRIEPVLCYVIKVAVTFCGLLSIISCISRVEVKQACQICWKKPTFLRREIYKWHFQKREKKQTAVTNITNRQRMV